MPNKNTGFIYSSEYLNHLTGIGHPESPTRLTSIINHLQELPVWANLHQILPTPAKIETVQLVHPNSYIQNVSSYCEGDYRYIDSGDTGICSESFSVAQLAAGGVVNAVDAILDGQLRNAFCAVRPPGHHAEVDRAMGFCLFNNAAIAARYAQSQYDIQKVLILDWDVHHGNGTQHIFEKDPNVYYISLHQYPFYPGSGNSNETGSGDGLGTTTNFPLSEGSGDKEYLDIFRNVIPDIVMKFNPELIILSAGFDAHRQDPLGGMQLTTNAFYEMSKIVVNISEDVSSGRLISVLEGGYDLTALAESVEVHLKTMVQTNE